ncbi:MAG: EamA family transporter [Actinomycetota bacterium]|nr:EamA family transporter [Actinomycetota bacterium]
MPSPLSRRAVRRAPSGLVQVTCAGLLWGTGGVVVRLLHDHAGMPAVSIAFYRLAVGAVALLGITGRRPRRLLAALRASPGLVAVAGIGLGAYQSLYFVAVTDVGVGVATMISIGLAPVLISAWEAVRQRRSPGLGATVRIALASGGLALVCLAAAAPSHTSPHPLVGLACALGSGVGYAATTLVSRHVGSTVDPVALTTLSSAIGALTLGPLATTSGLGFAAGAASVAELIYLGAMTTAAAFVLFYRGLQCIPASTAAVLTLLEPVVAAGLATLLLGDPLRTTTLVGGVLVIGSVAAIYASALPADR